MRLSRIRERWLLFFLLPSVVTAVLVLSFGSIRASLQMDKLRDQAVVEAGLELADERARRLDEYIIGEDNAVRAELSSGKLSEFSQRWLEMAQRQTPTVRAVLLFSIDSPEHDLELFATRAFGRDNEQIRHLIIYQFWEEMQRESRREPELLRHLHESYEQKSYLLSYWVKKIAGKRQLVVLWHDVPRVVHEMMPILYSESNFSTRMNVVDDEGRIIFGAPLSEGEFSVGRAFQTTLYEWRLNVAMSNAEQLAERATMRRIWGMALTVISALVIIAGSIVIGLAAIRTSRLSDLKNEFVANVSHELKTPLSLVRMFAELLQSGRVADEEKRVQYMNIIVEESDRLAALIDNVLDFARLERGDSRYQMQLADLRIPVNQAVTACRVRAGRADVAIETQIPEMLGPILHDPSAIEIATINLIDNAIKYASEGHWICVTIEPVGRSLRVSVEDRGPGISEADRERLFERFVRGAETHQSRGSGIGLALVKHIAEAHGGEAWIEAPQEGGSKFVFTIDAAKRPPSKRRLSRS